jgi:hypothetical protein
VQWLLSGDNKIKIANIQLSKLFNNVAAVHPFAAFIGISRLRKASGPSYSINP